MIIIPGMGNQTDVWTYNLKERIIHCVGSVAPISKAAATPSTVPMVAAKTKPNKLG